MVFRSLYFLNRAQLQNPELQIIPWLVENYQMLGLVKAVKRRHRRNAQKSLDIWALTLTYANQTQRPSAEQMLKAFCHITLYFLPDSTVFVTPINLLQKQILAAMNFPQSLYLPKLKPCPT